MIVINNIDSQRFSFNGVEYFKNFTPIVIGDKIRILNTYDSSIELTDSPRLYSEFSVNEIVFDNVASLQSYLLPIVFSRLSLNGDFLSNNISTYEEATLPIADTDQLFVIQGGEVKKVDKSDIGGTSNLSFYKLEYINVPVLDATTETFVRSILIPAGTFTENCKIEITFLARKEIVANSNFNPKIYINETDGNITDGKILTGRLVGSSNTRAKHNRGFVFSDNYIKGLSANFSATHDLGEIVQADASTLVDSNIDNYLNISYLDSSALNTVNIEWAEIKVYKNI